MPTLTVTPNRNLWGYDVIMSFGTGEVTGTAVLSKSYGGHVEYVRGFGNLSVTDNSYAITDVEVPIDIPTRYTLVQTIGGSFSATTTTPTVLTTTEMFVVRDLFSMTYSVVDDVIVGTIQDEESENRMGVFPIIGRKAPVVVLDTRQTTTSTLVLLPKTVDQTSAVRRLLSDGSPLLLQSMQSYNIGTAGLLYLQPGNITRSRVLPDARQPINRFEIEYTEISPPPAIVTFLPAAKTYDDLLDTYATYQDLFNAHKIYFELLYP